MNTATKIILILAAPLIALSCVPVEAELSGRSWGEVNTPKQTYNSNNYLPTNINTSTIVGDSDLPADREFKIDFPNSADVLRESNANIGAKLGTFLTIHTYDATELEEAGYTKLEDALPYSFVERVRLSTGATGTTRVTLRLNEKVAPAYAVIKINATTYTFRGGLKLDLNGDENFGEAIYDDKYFMFTIGVPLGANTFIPRGGDEGWSVDIGLPSITGSTITVATLSTTGLEIEDIVGIMKNQIVPKVKLQKYDGKSWVNIAEPFEVDETTGLLELKDFEPESTVHYRIHASGLKNLKAANEYLGAKQMIKVSCDGDTATFLRNTIVTQSHYWYDTADFAMQVMSPVGTADNYVTSDTDGTNVILHLRFITLGGVYPKEMTTAEFSKYFKIVYSANNAVLTAGDPGPLRNAANKLRYIGIKAVEYSSSTDDDDQLDMITLYLDPNYRLQATAKYILIAPGFKYITPQTDPPFVPVTFGDFANIDIEIDGVSCFRSYGSLMNGAANLTF